jgi:hypothetical protein
VRHLRHFGYVRPSVSQAARLHPKIVKTPSPVRAALPRQYVQTAQRKAGQELIGVEAGDAHGSFVFFVGGIVVER